MLYRQDGIVEPETAPGSLVEKYKTAFGSENSMINTTVASKPRGVNRPLKAATNKNLFGFKAQDITIRFGSADCAVEKIHSPIFSEPNNSTNESDSNVDLLALADPTSPTSLTELHRSFSVLANTSISLLGDADTVTEQSDSLTTKSTNILMLVHPQRDYVFASSLQVDCVVADGTQAEDLMPDVLLLNQGYVPTNFLTFDYDPFGVVEGSDIREARATEYGKAIVTF